MTTVVTNLCICGHPDNVHADAFVSISPLHGPMACLVENCECEDFKWRDLYKPSEEEEI